VYANGQTHTHTHAPVPKNSIHYSCSITFLTEKGLQLVILKEVALKVHD